MNDVRARLRVALRDAMRARDRTATAALRSALGAIDNAEAVDEARGPRPDSRSIAGATVGLGASEVPRRQLTDEEAAGIVRREADEREAAASEYDRLGQRDEAARLRTEAAVLREIG